MPTERLKLFADLQLDSDAVHLPLARVRSIDSYLRKEWGITLQSGQDQAYILPQVQAAATTAVFEEYRRLYTEQAAFLEDDESIPDALEREWYDFIAQEPLNGIFHSSKRTYIFDGLVSFIAIAEMARIKGRVLDVGCHTGYQTMGFATQTGLPVLGVDRSRRAIELAQNRPSRPPAATFAVLDCDANEPPGEFELVYCADAFPPTDEGKRSFLLWLGQAVTPGGLCALVGNFGADWSHLPLRRWCELAGLGYGTLNRVGGWTGEMFESKDLLVFVKGARRKFHLDAWPDDRSWGGFQHYANDPSVQWHAKTLGYYRAKLAAGALPRDPEAGIDD